MSFYLSNRGTLALESAQTQATKPQFFVIFFSSSINSIRIIIPNKLGPFSYPFLDLHPVTQAFICLNDSMFRFKAKGKENNSWQVGMWILKRFRLFSLSVSSSSCCC
jgi:hypothetical protein